MTCRRPSAGGGFETAGSLATRVAVTCRRPSAGGGFVTARSSAVMPQTSEALVVRLLVHCIGLTAAAALGAPPAVAQDLPDAAHGLRAEAAALGASPAAAQEPDARETGTAAMVARLGAIAAAEGRTNPYAGSVRARALASLTPPAAPPDRLRYRSEIARHLLYAGRSGEAAAAFDDVLREARDTPSVSRTFVSAVRQLLALSHLRAAMQRNCVSGPAAARCSVPVGREAVHPDDGAARRAIDEYARILGDPPDESTALAAQWLLNLAYMTVGEYPFHVPERWLVPPGAFGAEYDVGRFPDVAGRLGIDVAGRKGGSVMDDFDGDGRLDVVASSAGLFPVADGENPNQLRYFRNEGDGTFSDRTTEAGLDGLVSGLHVVQADYDNDGFLDLLVLRGAWLDAAHPNSLLRNNGDGTFSDVTEAAGLLMPAPTQAAAWGDYDNDGRVDLFIGNETRGGAEDSSDASLYPSRLFRNNGDGTFTDVAPAAGVDVVGFVKGAAWGDYDNDGRLDLYVTQIRPDQPNRLFRNEGPGADGAWSFRDAAAEAGVEGPPVSFPTWFFDYDNDGWEDIFVSGFSGGLADVVLERLGRPHRGQLPRLYRNDRDGTFTDVTRAAGLDRIMVGMGSNFGDFDNDGFLDLYLGTGDPDYRMLIPNLAFRNAAGERFLDVTASGGFGHLQKGHGVSFGDIDADGDQDLYHVSGGAFEGDTFPNALYLNPGHGNRWLTLRLEGAVSNRAAIGARIRVVAVTPDGDREVHVTVGSGGSFGGSSLQQEIGLGAASEIRTVAVTWPATGETDVYTGVGLDRAYRVREGAAALTPVALDPLDLRAPAGGPDSGSAERGDHRARGLDAAAVGDWPEALARFRQALASAPDDPMLNWYLGMALRLSGGDGEAAAAYLAEAARLEPALTTRAHLTIGAVREESGRREEAIGHFALAASEAAAGGEAHFRLAEALRRSGRAEAALGRYEQVSDRREARFGEVLALAELGRWREAHDRLAAGTERHPWEPAFPLALARLLAAAPDDALRDGARALALAQALAENVRTTAVAETVAMAHAELGRFATAVEWQRLAMSVAAEAGQPAAVQRMSANLAAYLRGEPCRTPWQDGELEQASAP